MGPVSNEVQNVPLEASPNKGNDKNSFNVKDEKDNNLYNQLDGKYLKSFNTKLMHFLFPFCTVYMSIHRQRDVS